MSDIEEEDPDCKNDPLYSMDIKQYLVTYLREFCQQPYFSHFAAHLTPQEVGVVLMCNCGCYLFVLSHIFCHVST